MTDLTGPGVYDSITDAIGGTPLVRLTRLTDGIRTPVYAKLEFLNPGGSVKDRAALAMITAAESAGLLGPGDRIVEATSGNTGIGLAVVAAQRGYRCTILVTDTTSPNKIALLRAYGAEVEVVDGALPREHPDHILARAARLGAQPGWWFADQYENPANPAAHEHGTGPELWKQTDGRMTHLVAGIGTGGTISGTARYLSAARSGQVTIVGADPEHSGYRGDGSPFYVEGIGRYVHPETVNTTWPASLAPELVHRVERIGDRESILTARALARQEGILTGASGGAAVAAALRVAREHDHDGPGGALIVVIIPDSGRNYLATYFNDEWLTQLGFLEVAVEGRGASAETVTALLSPVPAATWYGPEHSAAAALAHAHPEAEAVLVAVDRGPDAPAPVPGEVLGTVSLSALREAPADTTLHAVMSPAPPHIGVGESLADARHRLAPDTGQVLVLRDGRVAAVALLNRPAP